MSEKHYPYCGGSFDRIIFDKDGSVWVPETENAKLRTERDEWRRVAEAKQDIIDHMRDARAENAKLLEQMERLVTLLRVDCDIDASWDGLRRFSSIELTESGCLMRDRACKAEAENEKLRELVSDMWDCISHIGEYDVFYYDMSKDGCGISCTVNGEHCCADKLHVRMRELGIEVDA